MNELEQTTCKRCGRKLKSTESIEVGMGKTCLKKWQQENKHKKLICFVNNDTPYVEPIN